MNQIKKVPSYFLRKLTSMGIIPVDPLRVLQEK